MGNSEKTFIVTMDGKGKIVIPAIIRKDYEWNDLCTYLVSRTSNGIGISLLKAPLCPKCNNQVSDTDRFCRHCGKKL